MKKVIIMDLTKLDHILSEDGVVFLTYGGFLSQTLIVALTDALENEAQNHALATTISTNIFTIFIELAQNMMNYAKLRHSSDNGFDPKGLILVGYTQTSQGYYIMSRNIVSTTDKERIIPKIEAVLPLSKEELRLLYRHLRKEGKESHAKGAGIGFVEIARRCDTIDYAFDPINDHQCYFTFKATISTSMKD